MSIYTNPVDAIAKATAKLLFGKITLLIIRSWCESEAPHIEEIINRTVNETVDLLSSQMISIIIKKNPNLTDPKYCIQDGIVHLSTEQIARVNLCKFFQKKLTEMYQDEIREQTADKVMH